MGGGLRRILLAAIAAAIPALLPATASAAPTPGAYGDNDAGGFLNILPPGQGQSVNAAEIGAFLGGGTRPPHDSDQLQMYEDLVYATPGLEPEQLTQFYKDATFGVQPGDVERTYSPRADVTIVRDNFGVPRIYGESRAGAMFGAGYIAAEDRMFFIDALRHSGRAELASFAGGSEGNLEMDRSVFADTPYRNDSELQVQYDLADEAYGADGVQVQADVDNYVAGINKRISEIRTNPLLMPGEYPLLGHPEGPEDWKVTDVISIASLVAGIFGKGGGGEVNSALVLEQARKRFGKRAGMKVWSDFRRANDPEAPTTVRGRRFPYMPVPKRAKPALPDPRHDRGPRGRRRDDRERRAPIGARRAASCPTSATCSAACGSWTAPRTRCSSRAGKPRAGRRWRSSGPRSPTSRRRSCSSSRSTRPEARPDRRSTLAAPRSRERTSTSSSVTAATTPGRRPRRPRTSSTPSRSSSARATDRRRRWPR